MQAPNMTRVQQQLDHASQAQRAARSTPRYDVVSVRPQTGSAYSYRSADKDKAEAPGGKRLWCRLVVAFTCTSIFGLGLIILGSLFMQQAHGVHRTHGMSLPLVWCVVAIVSGLIMMIGSVILGKLIISNKWRKNEQPNYSRVSPSVRYQHRRRERQEQHNTNADMPPSYEQSIQPAVFIISSEPPSYVASPPAYSPPSSAPETAPAAGDPSMETTSASVTTVAPAPQSPEPAVLPVLQSHTGQ